jgi:uncharacterized membrane protein (UPF0136 family)
MMMGDRSLVHQAMSAEQCDGNAHGADVARRMPSVDWVLALVLAVLNGVGGTMGYVKKGSMPSLVAGGTFAILYFVAAILMVFPPGFAGKQHGTARQQAGYAKARRAMNKFAAGLGAALALLFLVRWYFFAAPLGMSLGLASLGVLSVLIHGMLSA